MIRIDRLQASDVARARRIRLRALRDAPDAYWTTAEEEAQRSDEDWHEGLAEGATFVATVDGSDVGLVRGGTHHDTTGDAGLYSMWVAPEARGQGVGEALIRAVIEWARADGFRCLRLEVADFNHPAIALYARMGFEPTGRVDTMPPPRDHIVEHERMLPLGEPDDVRPASR